jgi:hypothetical protein
MIRYREHIVNDQPDHRSICLGIDEKNGRAWSQPSFKKPSQKCWIMHALLGFVAGEARPVRAVTDGHADARGSLLGGATVVEAARPVIHRHHARKCNVLRVPFALRGGLEEGLCALARPLDAVGGDVCADSVALGSVSLAEHDVLAILFGQKKHLSALFVNVLLQQAHGCIQQLWQGCAARESRNGRLNSKMQKTMLGEGRRSARD